MSGRLEAERWDADYDRGRYEGEPPVPFVEDILADLGEEGNRSLGLYMGCGNGRNFIPLLRSGLDVRGIDISPVAIEQLIERCPEAEGKVRVESIDKLTASQVFDYVVAIQVFQHGRQAAAYDHFRMSRDVLKPGGRLFLRVNSISTQINHDHSVIERNEHGGFTVWYKDGPKKGTDIHFYSDDELLHIAEQTGFDVTLPIIERVEPRKRLEDGYWAQWETVWQKR